MRRFYAPVENIQEKQIHLDLEETRHLRDVLRLKVHDEVSVFDGVGLEFLCVIKEIGKKTSELEVMSETQPASPESPLDITIAATVLNGDKYDLVIQKSVELGVSTLVPLITIRCEVKISEAAKRLDRWRRIAMEATKQCGRAKLMRIVDPVGFSQFIDDSKGDNLILFSERDGKDFSTVKAGKKITAFYGPKGGWDDLELELAGKSGVNIVTLGGRVLRAETAAIAITAVLQHRFGDVN